MTPGLPLAHWIAHQGGWDEILLVAGPLAVFGGALWLANRRADARLASEADEAQRTTDPEIPESDAPGPQAV